MPDRQPNYYEVLGVPRNARREDIVRVHQRHRHEMQKATTPPDARREALFGEAYEVLSDRHQREAYDRELETEERRRKSYRRAMAGAVAVVAVAGGWLGWRAYDTPSQAAMRSESMRVEASAAVLRLQRIDLSGVATPAGLAVAVDEGLLVASCEGLASGAQLVVKVGQRTEPVTVTRTDEKAGICALRADHAGSWPLKVNGSVLRPGEKVYAANVVKTGELSLVEGRVRRVSHEPRFVEAVFDRANVQGAPLLDAQGRFVGIAARGRHVPVPHEWLASTNPMPALRAKLPEEPAAEAGEPASSDLPPLRRHRVEIPEDRRRAIEKAYGPPPPNVPDDL
jgi:hypothetical protein